VPEFAAHLSLTTPPDCWAGEVKEQRPAPIRHAHIQAFRNRVAAGMGHLNAEELDKLLDEQGMSDFFAKYGVGYDGTKIMAKSKVRPGVWILPGACNASNWRQIGPLTEIKVYTTDSLSDYPEWGGHT
jgi:hypothetical protein